MTPTNNYQQYDGEKIPGDLSSWRYFGTDPNNMLKWTYDVLSQRSTTLYHTHPPVSAGINKLTTYTIGGGLAFRSQPDWQTLGMTKQSAKDWGIRFQKLIHYLFVMTNFYEKQAILFRTAKIMGDSILLFDRSYDVGNGLFDLLDLGGDYIAPVNKTATDQNVTLGIVHDAAMRKKGIIGRDGQTINFRDDNGDQNIILYMTKNMSRQMRGYPFAYRLINSAKNNDRLWDATLARAALEATVLGKSKSNNPGSLKEQSEILSQLATGQTVQSSTAEGLRSAGNVSGMPTGSVLEMGTADDFEFMDMKTPSNNFDKLQMAFIDLVGMALGGLAPEFIMSKYSTSFTAHKGGLNDCIMIFRQERKGFINTVMKPTIVELAKYAFLNNYIEMPNPRFFDDPIIREATIAGNYLAPVPLHINPAQEVQAKIAEVGAGFDLRSSKALENGHDWDNFIEEWQQEEDEYNKRTIEQQAAMLQKDDEQKQADGGDSANDDMPDSPDEEQPQKDDSEDENI